MRPVGDRVKRKRFPLRCFRTRAPPSPADHRPDALSPAGAAAAGQRGGQWRRSLPMPCTSQKLRMASLGADGRFGDSDDRQHRPLEVGGGQIVGAAVYERGAEPGEAGKAKAASPVAPRARSFARASSVPTAASRMLTLRSATASPQRGMDWRAQARTRSDSGPPSPAARAE